MHFLKKQFIYNTLYILFCLLILFLVLNIPAQIMPKFDVYLFCIDICLILCSIKFLQYNKWTETHDDISYPPDPFDSAQAGYILDGYTDDRDIISLLIRWGQLGHLKILVSDGDIYLKKLDKMPKTIPLYERDLFAQLFADSPTVNILELNQKFFVSIAEARRKVDAFFCIPENHIYSLESLAMQRMVSAFLTVPFILCLIATYTKQLEPDSSYDLIAILLVAGLIGLIMTLPVKAFIDTAYHWNSLSSQQKTNKFLFCIVFSIVITGFFLAYTAQELPLLSFLSLGSVILMACLIFFVRKRTPQGQEWAARLLGLKKFIQEASPKTILRLVNEDPHYYFNILPYAYVMGVSEKWSERFDAANIYPFYCPWFELTGMPFITYSAFHKALFDALECITLSMTSRPPIKTK